MLALFLCTQRHVNICKRCELMSLNSILRASSIPQSNYLCLGHIAFTLEDFFASVIKHNHSMNFVF